MAKDQAMTTFDRRFIDEMEKDGFCDKLAR